jgi:F-type H+-transporting ATPase subunit b
MDINFTLVMQAVSFAVFIWLTAKFIWPMLMDKVDIRQKQIADGIAAGEEGRHSLASAEKRIAEMVAEAKGRSSEIIAQGEKLKSETVDAAKAEAKAEAERILVAAKAEIVQEITRAKESLRDQVADLAVAGAAKILKREVDAKAHADLLASIRREL